MNSADTGIDPSEIRDIQSFGSVPKSSLMNAMIKYEAILSGINQQCFGPEDECTAHEVIRELNRDMRFVQDSVKDVNQMMNEMYEMMQTCLIDRTREFIGGLDE